MIFKRLEKSLFFNFYAILGPVKLVVARGIIPAGGPMSDGSQLSRSSSMLSSLSRASGLVSRNVFCHNLVDCSDKP